MAGQKILLVDDDSVILKLVGAFLERIGFQVGRASNGLEALKLVRQHLPDLVITDVRMPELNGIELTTRLRGHHRTARVPIIMLSSMAEAKDALVGYSAGADEYLPKPFELTLLEAKVRALLQRAVAVGAAGSARGKVIVFAHAKGGVGNTSLAINVATVLASSSPGTVGLLDLDVEFGNIASFLNVQPTKYLADLGADAPAQVDDAYFEQFVTHTANIRVVVGANLPERAELVTLPAIRLAIDRLRSTCDYVLIDVPVSFTERTLMALDTCDLICLITSPSLPALRATRDCLSVFEKMGLPSDRIRLILNHSTTHAVGLQQATTVLGRKPDFIVPRSENLDQAANTGHPVVTADPGDPIVSELENLTNTIVSALPSGVDKAATARQMEEYKQGLGKDPILRW
jgi:pilus assembly protein CpaE